MLVNLHGRRYRLVVWAWKPFKWCVVRCQSIFQLNTNTSLIETFATFILLSCVKLLGVCFDLLGFSRSHDETGRTVKWYLFYDANIRYFSVQHLPYVLLSLVITSIFVILPFLLLVLYPCWFQRCLNC